VQAVAGIRSTSPNAALLPSASSASMASTLSRIMP
jgi:hypothetical protein